MGFTRQQLITTLQPEGEWVSEPKDIIKAMQCHIDDLYALLGNDYESMSIPIHANGEDSAFSIKTIWGN